MNKSAFTNYQTHNEAHKENMIIRFFLFSWEHRVDLKFQVHFGRIFLVFSVLYSMLVTNSIHITKDSIFFAVLIHSHWILQMKVIHWKDSTLFFDIVGLWTHWWNFLFFNSFVWSVKFYWWSPSPTKNQLSNCCSTFAQPHFDRNELQLSTWFITEWN